MLYRVIDKSALGGLIEAFMASYEVIGPVRTAEGVVFNEEMVLITQTKKELQEIMSNYVGIVRSDLRMHRALNRLNLIYRETEALYRRSVLTEELSELRNLIACAYLITKQAMERRENRGLHYSIDLLKGDKKADEAANG